MERNSVLENYRSKTSDELKETFEGMSEAALSGIWLNFDARDWAECAEAMAIVIKERGGWGDDEE